MLCVFAGRGAGVQRPAAVVGLIRVAGRCCGCWRAAVRSIRRPMSTRGFGPVAAADFGTFVQCRWSWQRGEFVGIWSAQQNNLPIEAGCEFLC